MPRAVLTPLRRRKDSQSHAERQRSHSPARRAPTVRYVRGGLLRVPPKSLPTVEPERSEPNLTRDSPPRLRGYSSPYAASAADPRLRVEQGQVGRIGAKKLPSVEASFSHVGLAIQTNLGLRVVNSGRRNKWLAPQKEVQAEDVALCMLATHKLELEKNLRKPKRQQSIEQMENVTHPSRESLLHEGSLDSWLLPPDQDIFPEQRPSSAPADEDILRRRPSSSTASIDLDSSIAMLLHPGDRNSRRPRSVSGSSVRDEDSMEYQGLMHHQQSWWRRERATSPQLDSEKSFDEGSSTKSQFISLLFQAPACDIIAGPAAEGDQERVTSVFARNILLSAQASLAFSEFEDGLASGQQSPSLDLRSIASRSGDLSPKSRSDHGLSEDEDHFMGSESGDAGVATHGAFPRGQGNRTLGSPLPPDNGRSLKSKRFVSRQGDDLDADNMKSGQFYQAGMLDSMVENMHPATDAARKADVKAMKERKIHFARVQEVLKEMVTAKIRNVADLRKFHIRYCPPESVQLTSSLVGLEKALAYMNLHDEFFDRILRDIVRRALQFFHFFPRGQVPVMRKKEGKITILRVQAAALLSMTFLCGMPKNELSMAALLCSQQQYQVAKLQFFIHYFDRLAQIGAAGPVGEIEFRRIEQEHNFSWSASTVPLRPFKISTGFVANQHGSVQVVTSHRNIGAGVLHRGRGEEEVVFCTCPELCVAMFMVQRVGASEAIVVKGVERFCRYSGDGSGWSELEYAGDWRDPTRRDDHGSLESCWLLIDPTKFEREDTIADQMESAVMRRDLNKCFTGFEAAGTRSGLQTVTVSDWGCDSLWRGDLELKVLVLWMASSTANLKLHMTLAEVVASALRDTLLKLRLLVDRCCQEGVTVAQLFESIQEAATLQPRSGYLIAQIMTLLGLDRDNPGSRNISAAAFASSRRTASSRNLSGSQRSLLSSSDRTLSSSFQRSPSSKLLSQRTPSSSVRRRSSSSSLERVPSSSSFERAPSSSSSARSSSRPNLSSSFQRSPSFSGARPNSLSSSLHRTPSSLHRTPSTSSSAHRDTSSSSVQRTPSQLSSSYQRTPSSSRLN